MRRAAGLTLALAALACAGCADTTPSSAGLACSATPGDHPDGAAVVHVPPRGGAGDRLPILVVAHPAGESGPHFARFLDVSAAADAAHVLVLYPTAHAKGFWQLDHKAGDADVQDVKDLLGDAARTYCGDPARVAVAGVSNGGGFAARLGCELADRVRAVVSIAGSYRALDPCRPSQPVSLLEMHGTADTVVPYSRGVLAFVQHFARLDGCAASPQRDTPRRRVVRLRWHGCRSGTTVEHLRLGGTGHGWFGVRVIQGADPTGVKATAELFRFLRESGVSTGK